MSGCHEPLKKTLECCKHGMPVKLGCSSCYVESLIDRVEKVESTTLSLNKSIAELYDRLEYQCKNGYMYQKGQIDAQNEMIKVLETKVEKMAKEILETRLQFIDQLGNDKKPHKCPICASKGFVNGVENNIAWGHRCNTCEGKGIVWG